MNKNTAQFPFLSILTLIFITLKLIGSIDWSWWWVLAPMWIPFSIFGVVLLVLFVLAVITGVRPAFKRRR